MTEILNEYDWDALEASTSATLREPKVVPVPDGIVRQAQQAVTGVTMADGEVRHTLEYEFPTAEVAAEFAKHMKNAGKLTTPVSTITVLVDPVGVARKAEVNPRLVRWQAGARRGKPAAG
jgi:hypothetical protein